MGRQCYGGYSDVAVSFVVETVDEPVSRTVQPLV